MQTCRSEIKDEGKIVSVDVIRDEGIGNVPMLNGNSNARLGLAQMINHLGGGSSYDGYRVTTDKHVFMVLIDNGQSCCEEWGYFACNDDLDYFIGATLWEMKLTDTALNQAVLEKEPLTYLGDGGVQFVDFVTDRGVFQIAVYNSHNGYYGHPIIVSKDNKIIHQDTL